MKSKCASYGLGVAALALLASASASAATLARQRGAFGIVTYDVPIVIESVADWDALSAAVAGGLSTEGAIVLLANDVGPVTHMVGDSVHPFVGVFDGNGHTLTVAISGTGDCAAPFSVIDGATISNLVVTGTVSGGNHSAGLVGTCGATGPNVIRDCTVSVAVSGTGYLGGIVGHGGQGTLSFEGCVFSGAVSGFSAFAGGLMGWSNSMALNVTNCLSAGTFAPGAAARTTPSPASARTRPSPPPSPTLIGSAPSSPRRWAAT